MSSIRLDLDCQEAKIEAVNARKINVVLHVDLEQLVEAVGEEILDDVVKENRDRILDLIGEEYVRRYFEI